MWKVPPILSISYGKKKRVFFSVSYEISFSISFFSISYGKKKKSLLCHEENTAHNHQPILFSKKNDNYDHGGDDSDEEEEEEENEEGEEHPLDRHYDTC